MMSVLYVICATIIICMLIRYVCIWKCQSIEYKLYRTKKASESPYCIRPRFYNPKEGSSGDSFMGFVVFDLTTNEPYTGVGTNTIFTLYRNRSEAEAVLKVINDTYGY